MRTSLYLLLLVCLGYSSSFAQQSSIKFYHSEVSATPLNMISTSDNGIMIGGGFVEFGNQGFIHNAVLKTDLFGNEQYRQFFNDEVQFGTNGPVYMIEKNNVIYGLAKTNTSTSIRTKSFFFSMDLNGSIIDSKTFAFADSTLNTAATGLVNGDGNSVITSQSYQKNFSYDSIMLILRKLDLSGQPIWEKTYFDMDTNLHYTNYLTDADSSSFYVSGVVNKNNGSNKRDFFVMKCAKSTGDTIWTKEYDVGNYDNLQGAFRTSDNGLIFHGSRDNPANPTNTAYMMKLDSNGITEWDYLGSTYYYNTGVEIADGFLMNSRVDTGITITKVDFNGNLVWEKDILSNFKLEVYDLELRNGKDLYLTGRTANTKLGFLLMTDTTLHEDVNWLNIQTYYDQNNNCNLDSAESIGGNSILEFMGNQPVYIYPGDNGSSNVIIDTGAYSVSHGLPSPYWDSTFCEYPNGQVIISSSDDTLLFGLNANTLCPYLEVDIATPFIRFCDTSTIFYVNYANHGTIAEDSAYITVSLDSNLIVHSSSIPWTNVIGNTYTFPIGEIGLFETGMFQITASASCDSTYIGQILCTEAHIYPDSLCTLPASWTGASLKATASCAGTDSVHLSLKNIGTGDMNDPTEIVIIEDIILILNDSVALDVNQEIEWTLPVAGMTYRITGEQPTGHPLSTFTTDAVSLCNTFGITLPGPIIDTTFFAYPNDEESPFIAIDCNGVIAAIDPNDKTVYPAGATSNHYITDDTELEYKIRFQNTGTDTAFLVYITDTIMPELDVTTIRPGASSHPYKFDLIASNIVQFTFENILLPDSNVNESASHGFVQYKIDQKTGNVPGTVINNMASIYFDYNPPVLTNVTENRIGKIYIDTVLINDSVISGIPGLNNIQVNVYPNPFSSSVKFELTGSYKGDLKLELFDLSGKHILYVEETQSDKIILEKGQLSNGIYLFNFSSEKGVLATGQILVK